MGSETNIAMLVLAVGIIVFLFGSCVSARNCGCSRNLCCSKYGYWGTGNDYYGTGCKGGQCYTGTTPSPSTGSGTAISSVTSKDFFDPILSIVDGCCAGKNFYTYDGFIQAANAYSGFGTTGTSDDSKRDLAAFFAHVPHETGSFCYIEEINGASKDYCDETNTEYPCVGGKGYFGRGPILLSRNFNYGPTGKAVGFDGLNELEKVANDAAITFKTTVWFWMKNSNCHTAITSGQGFGAIIQVVNGSIECNGGNTDVVNKRVTYYKNYCAKLGVDLGSNLSY